MFTISSFTGVSPLYSAAFSTFFASLFFAVLLTWKKNWGEWKKKEAWGYIFWSSAIIGVMFYSILFYGLRYTTAGNAAIFGLMEILFTFLFFGIWKKEKHKMLHIWGAVCMVIGALLILFPGGAFSIQKGDIIIIVSTIIPPLGNYFQQEARKHVSASFLMFVRSMISSFFLFILAFFLSKTPTFVEFQMSFVILLLNGCIIFGLSKWLWIESIHRLSVSKALSLSAISPLFTLIFAYFLLHEIPTVWQFLGLFPIIFGVFMLMYESKKLFLKNETH